jgi:hypothetical protein
MEQKRAISYSERLIKGYNKEYNEPTISYARRETIIAGLNREYENIQRTRPERANLIPLEEQDPYS